MAERVSWEALRQLAAFRAQRGCAISLFLNLDPSLAATAGEVATRINSLLAEGERSEAATRPQLGHEERVGLKNDFERIRNFFASDFNREGMQGFAVFAAGLDRAWSTVELPAPVKDEICVGPDFRIAPLVPLATQPDGTLVAHVSREHGRLYRLRNGQLDEVVDRSEEQPYGHHDQGGWSQARYARHVDKLVADHLKTVASELEEQRRAGAPKIVLVCPEDTRPGFLERLSKEARSAVVGWTNVEAHAGPTELLAAVAPVLEDARAKDEGALVERWREEAGKGGRAASGWRDTLDAASDARIATLLYELGARHEAFQCPQCGRASVTNGACPLDGETMEPRPDGLDLAVRHTIGHGGTALPLRHRHDLEPVEGIAALLRF
ncbi:MAG TPA: Vms1/Ankzf1 family peptidyl-tRNA hydrolase [Gaiellaceae bacterium]